MSDLLIDLPLEGVARLTLNRPEKRNALNLALRAEIAAALGRFDADPAIRCVVLAGGDRVFAAGADLAEMATRTPFDHRLEEGRVVWSALEAFTKPIISAVRGYAIGGGAELAIATDIVIAGEGATFGFPEAKLGILAGAGGTQRLVRLAGRQRAMRWLLTGDLMDARMACSLGIVSEVVADDQVMDHALLIASRICGAAPLSVAAIKSLGRAGPDLPLTAALEAERSAFRLLLTTDDFQEGVAAFFSKRTPRFQGK